MRCPANKLTRVVFIFIVIVYPLLLNAQTGSPAEPVRYIGGESIDPSVHEGRLRWAVGVESIQVMRANRKHGGLDGDSGWTYNHAPNLAYWNGKFYLQYLSNPKDEHIAPGHTLIMTSVDGRRWEKPRVLFPPYQAPAGVKIPFGYTGYMMHQRMGFYTAPNGRLLTLAFYGHTEDPFQKGGIGRVVREIYKDGGLGPIYFIKYETHANWNESNTAFPFYTKSKDTGFVAACNALLKDKLKVLQWKDEDDDGDPKYALNEDDNFLAALSYFHRKDGKVVMLGKKSRAALSEDEGAGFSYPVKVPTLIMSGGKNWGQKTKDGRYAMVYNPIDNSEYRYPLIIVTGEDGIIFDNMLLVQGEVPPRRFFGRWKDFGPSYTRGIVEGNGNPRGNDMWITYSMNKEDMWVTRIPVPVTYKVDTKVNDDFNALNPGCAIPGWNTYSPQWAPVTIADFPNSRNRSLQLVDEDPYDYARAIRVFKESSRADIRFRVYAEQQDHGQLSVDITDRYGNRPIQINFSPEGNIEVMNGSKTENLQKYQSGSWYDFQLKADASIFGSFELWLNGKKVITNASLAEAVKSVERISFRTGAYRNIPTRTTPNETPEPPLPGADEKVKRAVFYIDDVKVE